MTTKKKHDKQKLISYQFVLNLEHDTTRFLRLTQTQIQISILSQFFFISCIFVISCHRL